ARRRVGGGVALLNVPCRDRGPPRDHDQRGVVAPPPRQSRVGRGDGHVVAPVQCSWMMTPRMFLPSSMSWYPWLTSSSRYRRVISSSSLRSPDWYRPMSRGTSTSGLQPP